MADIHLPDDAETRVHQPRHAELVSASMDGSFRTRSAIGGIRPWTPGSGPGQALKQVQGDEVL